jgi:hypothetical protein
LALQVPFAASLPTVDAYRMGAMIAVIILHAAMHGRSVAPIARLRLSVLWLA